MFQMTISPARDRPSLNLTPTRMDMQNEFLCSWDDLIVQLLICGGAYEAYE